MSEYTYQSITKTARQEIIAMMAAGAEASSRGDFAEARSYKAFAWGVYHHWMILTISDQRQSDATDLLDLATTLPEVVA